MKYKIMKLTDNVFAHFFQIQNSGRVPIDNMTIDVTLVDRVRGHNLVYVSDLSVSNLFRFSVYEFTNFIS